MSRNILSLPVRLALVWFAIVTTNTAVHPATLKVPSEQPTIQAGIDAAKNEDTVLVAPGSYVEHLVILNKTVFIVSRSGPDSTFLNWPGGYDEGILISTGLTGGLIGFTIKDQSDIVANGIVIRCSSATIKNNRFINVAVGRNLLTDDTRCNDYIGGKSILVSHNLFANIAAPNANLIFERTPAVVANNTVTLTMRGIGAYSSGSVVKNNIVTHCSKWAIFAGGRYLLEEFNCFYYNSQNFLHSTISSSDFILDPLFISREDNNYHLTPSSPCVDAGDSTMQFRDPDGTRNDIGAFPTNQCFGPSRLDSDSDGLPDNCDICPNDPDNDSDDDGICDDVDDCIDFDQDGICKDVDNCLTTSNADQLDSDLDGTGDARDTDRDNDFIPDINDNCPDTPNFDQLNQDGDGMGDKCDPDVDDDLVSNDLDNCVMNFNPVQEDADGDGVGDACDFCPLDSANDIDGDGICANVDNCPTVTNPLQSDIDGDFVGDTCDNCKEKFNIFQTDADNDGFGDDCDDCPEYPLECCCSLGGDYDNNGVFGIDDVALAIARLFSNTEAPLCLDAADANGDNNFDLADVTYGIAHIFAGGPAPVCGSTGL
jgi:Thrombospondin type 3 repeat